MDSKGASTARELFNGQAHLYNLTFNYVNSMAVKCAMELGIADKIHSHNAQQQLPITLSELASALEIHPTKTIGLRRLMRLLVHSGLFSIKDDKEEDEAYSLTPSSTLLLKDHPNSLEPYVLLSLNSITSFHSLSKWFKGNEETACETTFGMILWDYMEKNQEFATMFNKAMESDSEMANLVVKDCKQIFEGVGSLVDVGGGTGTFCRIICETFPSIKCTVFDLPHVVANLHETENLKFVGGDMLAQPIPPADAILLKLLFHGYGDEESLKVLKRCRESLSSKGDGSGGKLIIIDIVINEKKDEHELTETKLFYDMVMMVHVTGKERTEKEWEKLFLQSGFTRYKITPIFGLRSLIEVYP